MGELAAGWDEVEHRAESGTESCGGALVTPYDKRLKAFSSCVSRIESAN